MMERVVRAGMVICLMLAMAACEPSDRRPGMWLSGDVAAWPSDWSFTDQVPQIAIQVRTPYWVPHSVTIWCSQVGGRLYVGASAPETKRWPGWVDSDPGVRLKIDGKVYEALLVPFAEGAEVGDVQRAFAVKYQLKGEGAPGSSRLWRVESRAS